MSETYEDNIYNTDYGLREYSAKCEACKKKNTCF
jgi:hypothetical protein